MKSLDAGFEGRLLGITEPRSVGGGEGVGGSAAVITYLKRRGIPASNSFYQPNLYQVFRRYINIAVLSLRLDTTMNGIELAHWLSACSVFMTRTLHFYPPYMHWIGASY